MRLSEADINSVKRQLLTMHYHNRVGHLGGNLSAIDAMMVLHHELMEGNDRFILSKGHSAGAYYVTLWSLGLISELELTTFHKDGTRLSGHPPARGIREILFSTGSLGHGLSLAAGLGLAARLRGEAHRIFCLTSDGEWQEGSTIEALVFACHHRLSNLTVLVDHNGLQGFGSTAEVATMDPLSQILSGFNIDLRRCNGHDLQELRDTVGSQSNRPVVVLMDTLKGHGVPDFEGRMESHYLPLTESQYQAAIGRLDGETT
jgi:transketolase